MADGKVIWTPDGLKTIGLKTPDRIELRPSVGEWLYQFADIAASLRLGLHCGICGGDVIGKNGDSDRVMSVTCGCREWVWSNREWMPAAAPKLH